PVANQNNEQIRDHGSLTFRIEDVSEVLLVELIESVFNDAHGALDYHTSGGNHCAGRLLAKHSARDLRRVGEVGDSCFKNRDTDRLHACPYLLQQGFNYCIATIPQTDRL